MQPPAENASSQSENGRPSAGFAPATCIRFCSNPRMSDHKRVDLAAVDLYGRIEALVRDEPASPTDNPGAGVASSRDALAAVAQLALTVEKPAQSGDLDPEVAQRMASLLLVIRDYIHPVEDDDRISRYLTEVVSGLR